MTAPDILSTMVAEPAPEQPDDVPMLNGREEAALFGRHKSEVSKARKDPAHPARSDPRTRPATLGRITLTLVPADAAGAYWRARPKKLPGPRPQRVYLAMAAKGETIPKRSRAKLIERGLLGDDGTPTDAGLAVLAGDGAPAQDQETT